MVEKPSTEETIKFLSKKELFNELINVNKTFGHLGVENSISTTVYQASGYGIYYDDRENRHTGLNYLMCILHNQPNLRQELSNDDFVRLSVACSTTSMLINQLYIKAGKKIDFDKHPELEISPKTTFNKNNNPQQRGNCL